jgi:hypothetical protein
MKIVARPARIQASLPISVMSPAIVISGCASSLAAMPSGLSKTKKAMAMALIAESVKPFQGTRRWIVRRA